MTRRRLLSALAVVLVALLTGCGDDEPPEVPRAVDPSLAPTEVVDGNLSLYEDTSDATRRAFADAGPTSLVGDGRIWEIRRADRLVGTLQVSTLVPEVDLSDLEARETIVQDILVGGSTRVQVHDVEIATLRRGDQAVYVWFGDDLLAVLTVDGFQDIDPEDVLEDVVAHQLAQSAWVPVQAGEDDVPLDLPEA